MNRWRLTGSAGVLAIVMMWPVACTTGQSQEKSTTDGGTTKETKTDSGKVGNLKWYTTCGDPVCRGYKPSGKLTLCTTQSEGQACSRR